MLSAPLDWSRSLRPPSLGVVAIRLLLLVAATLLASFSSVAAPPTLDFLLEQPAFSQDPHEILRAAGPLPTIDAPAEILLDDTRYTFAPAEPATKGEAALGTGRHVVEFRRVFRLVRETGSTPWRSIYAAYAPWLDEKPTIVARVILPDGSVRMLDPKTVVDSIEPQRNPDVISDRRRVIAALPAVMPGAIVEEVIRIVHKRAYFDAGSVVRVGLGREVPTRRSKLTLMSPASLALRTRIEGFPDASDTGNVNISFSSKREDGRVVESRTWDLRRLPPTAKREPGTPAGVAQGASVLFSTGKSWNDVATAYHEIVEAQIAGAKVQGFTNGIAPVTPTMTDRVRREAAAEVLTRLRLVVRYTGIELGEAAVIPRAPAQTLERGYGDCKDQAAVLIAALRELGFEAHMALLTLGPGPDVSEDLPGLGLFNHAIVVVGATSVAPAFWIDSTRPFSEPGALPLLDQGRLALIAAPSTEGLQRTPRSSADDNRYTETRTIHLADNGPAYASEVTRATGSLRQTLRGFFDDKPTDALERKFTDYVRAEYGAPRLLSLDRPPLRSPFDPFLLRLEVDKATRFSTEDTGAKLRLHSRMAWSFLPSFLAPGSPDVLRTAPLTLAEPMRAEIVYRVFLPMGFDWNAVPAPIRIRVGPATLRREVVLADGAALEVRFVVDTGDGVFSPSEVSDFRRALHRFSKEGPTELRVVHIGKRAITEGRVAEGLDVYRALIDRAPTRAIHHERLADQLLELGLGHAARVHSQRAVEVEPKSSGAWASLGWTLLHDELGRKFGPGFDRVNAIVAFRKAIALSPGDPQAQANLAIALEHGEAGGTYGRGADLASAISTYEQRRALTGERDYDVNLMRAYFRTGRFSELLALAPKVKRSPVSDSLYIGAVAALEGPERALERAQWLIEAPDVRREAIEVAGDVLPLVGKYAAAAVLLRAAAPGAEDPARLLSRVRLLESSRAHEACGAKELGPQRLVEDWYRALYGTKDRDGLARRLDDLGRNLASGVEGLRSEAADASRITDALSRRSLPGRLLLDAALCGTDVDVEPGPTSTLVRVRPRDSGPGAMFPAPEHTWFLSPLGGRAAKPLRVVTVAGSLSSDFGHEALAWLAKGRLDGARAWLDHGLTTWRAGDPPFPSSDALDSPPFVRVWAHATDAERKRVSFVRVAAALLVASGSNPKVALPVLVARRNQRERKGEERVRIAVLESLAHGLVTSKKPKDATIYATELCQREPNSRTAYSLLNEALWDSGNFSELEIEARKRLDDEDTGEIATQTLSFVELAQGQYAAADARLRRLTKTPGPISSRVFNHLAWSALFRDKKHRDAEAALDDALAATRAMKRPTASSLQTLAAVYASLDRPSEAIRALKRAVDARPDRKLTRDDFFVFGRVAESYRLSDEARAAYSRTKPDDASSIDSFDTWFLSENRLKVLKSESPSPAALGDLPSSTERSLIREIDRLRRASDAATERATSGSR